MRRRSGRWEASRSDLTTGRRRTRSFPTEAEAYAWCAPANATGPVEPAPTPTVRRWDLPRGAPERTVTAAADAWLTQNYHQLRRGGPERAAGVEIICRRHIGRHFAGIDVAEVDTDSAVALMRGMADADVSYNYSKDVLWVLAAILEYARTQKWLDAGWDPLSQVRPLRPRSADEQARAQPVTLVECRDLAGHLHVVHQLVLWLQRILGLRISESFGPHVRDVVTADGVGLLTVEVQGGRQFLIAERGETAVSVAEKRQLKRSWSRRVLPIPAALMALIDLVILAFHTDPATGEIDVDARLVPGLARPDVSGQAAYRNALSVAVDAVRLDGRKVGPHLMRKSLASALAYDPTITEAAKRRFVGKTAGDDDFARTYTLDDPELRAFRAIAERLDRDIVAEVGSLIVPTARSVLLGHANPLKSRAREIDHVLRRAGALVDAIPAGEALCGSARVAELLGCSVTEARRRMTSGEVPCQMVTVPGRSKPQRLARQCDVEHVLQAEASHITLASLAVELGVVQRDVWEAATRLGIGLHRLPGRRAAVLTDADRSVVVAEFARVDALHARSLTVTAAATQLQVSRRFVDGLLARGALTADGERDSSGQRFVTRLSVEAWAAHRSRRTVSPPSEPSITVDALHAVAGRSTRSLMTLARTGQLVLVDGRAPYRVSLKSVEAWASATDPAIWRNLMRSYGPICVRRMR